MHRRVFVQRSVSSRSIIVAGVAVQHASKMRLAKDNGVVQAFAANGPNQSFGKAVLPWRPRSARCLIPAFDGAIFSVEWKDALWARFFMEAPRRRRRSVERYSIVKRA